MIFFTFIYQLHLGQNTHNFATDPKVKSETALTQAYPLAVEVVVNVAINPETAPKYACPFVELFAVVRVTLSINTRMAVSHQAVHLGACLVVASYLVVVPCPSVVGHNSEALVVVVKS